MLDSIELLFSETQDSSMSLIYFDLPVNIFRLVVLGKLFIWLSASSDILFLLTSDGRREGFGFISLSDFPFSLFSVVLVMLKLQT